MTALATAAGLRLPAVLGTMTIGPGAQLSTVESGAALVERFVAWPGHAEGAAVHLDTARMYDGGNTETRLGEILGARPGLGGGRTTFASKANPWGAGTAAKALTAGSVDAQMAASLEALRAESVEIYYLHAPDTTTPILETLQAVDALHKAGKFKRFGLSNYQAWEVAHIHGLCKRHGFVLPTVYQGMLNYLTRDVHRELFPCLRQLGMGFYAYNPLAGGLLTGKHTDRAKLAEGAPKGSRFDASNKMYRERCVEVPLLLVPLLLPLLLLRYHLTPLRYLREAQLDATDLALAACKKHSVDPAAAAIRWVTTHSGMGASLGDAIIVGASSIAHLDANLEACLATEPLHDDIISAMDSAWDVVKGHGACPSYERGFSLCAPEL